MIYALKHPSLFRPASRPTSPAPAPLTRNDSGLSMERSTRPLNKLSFSGFRRPSPMVSSPAPAPTPVLLVQDGSYLEALSLKLSEAVSKALSQPLGSAGSNEIVGGKRPIPPGRGHAFGALITSELKATRENPHLHRAIIRSLHRPLSVLLSNLSALLLPVISSPAFLSPAAPGIQFPTPNATQLHALAIATFAGELLSSFDSIGLGLDGDPRGDGLRSVREGLVSLIGRVINPLVAGVKAELMPLIEALETPVSVMVPKTSSKLGLVLHPSITSLQTLMPIYARAMARYTASLPSQATLATFLISVIWRALVALSHRRYVPPSPPTSPLASPQLGPVLSKRQRATSGNALSSSGNTPPVTPPSSRFSIKLPPSRPPSPPNVATFSTAAADARALYELLLLMPRPALDNDATRVAREAVDEAYADLKSLGTLLESVGSPSFKADKSPEQLLEDLDALSADLPTLIALPVLLRGDAFGIETGSPSATSVALLLGIPEVDYRTGCLAGFGRAEECGNIVGQGLLDIAHEHTGVEVAVAECVTKWLENRVNANDH
ncbi:hypothetical protein BJ138DRAFT_1114532 [Hygrophoropsis aurantiaca]|uniref:Uncharacterized protein n=1 Tax=Hygrophoropsis aurantiaca TaxID=72124 RepID=A0ACB8A9A9_9AGAM|nr:hypothetical protein BJ138DRAFT_1114532 [Hygrophoropsis aurantiaca]